MSEVRLSVPTTKNAREKKRRNELKNKKLINLIVSAFEHFDYLLFLLFDRR